MRYFFTKFTFNFAFRKAIGQKWMLENIVCFWNRYLASDFLYQDHSNDCWSEFFFLLELVTFNLSSCCKCQNGEKAFLGIQDEINFIFWGNGSYVCFGSTLGQLVWMNNTVHPWICVVFLFLQPRKKTFKYKSTGN